MKIIYKVGDVTKAEEYIIAHGCNAQGKMNSGVAKVIRAEFPGVFDAYVSYLELHNNPMGYGRDPVGTVCLYVHHYSGKLFSSPKEKMIANMITQRNYGRSGEIYVDYDAVRSCMRYLNKRARMYTKPPHAVAMPMIGAGLGGGDWNIISSIIEEESIDFQPVVYTLQ